MRRGVRSALAQLIPRFAARALAAIALVLAASCLAASAQPVPLPSATPPSPKVPLHAEVFVETNKLGQVSHIVSMKPSGDKGFNTQTYGNASQAFIRTEDGKAVVGLYRLSYDYDPATKKVRRSVALIKAGGIDPNAPGIVTVIQKHLDDAQGKSASPLPDFNKIVQPTPH